MIRLRPGTSIAERSRNAALSLAVLLAALLPAAGHAQAGPCKDPWINTAFQQIYRRAPIGSGSNLGECDVSRYGNGRWSSYQDLVTKIAQHGTGTHANPTTASGTGVIGTGGGSRPTTGSLIGGGGSGIVAQGGGNIVAQGGGNVVGQNANGLIGQDGNGLRAVQSVDKPHAAPGRYLVIPGGSLVDANGRIVRQAGSYTLIARNGAYTIGTGTGARVPTVGTVVVP